MSELKSAEIRISAHRKTVPFFDLSDHHLEVRSELEAAFARVMASSHFILGRELETFEKAFADFCGVKHAIGVGNGLDALTLILKAFDLGAGDEVIVPAHTFVASWLAVDQAGGVLVPAEVNQTTFNLDPAAVRAAITPRTKAIIAVHLYGRVAEMEKLFEIAAPQGILVIEDAAQAHGARRRGRRAGCLGHAAAFSFYPTKNLGALGDGGAITTNDDQVAERVRMLRNYGSKAKYVHELLGTNSRLDELQAALLCAKLPNLDSKNARRREIARRYHAGLHGCRGILVPDLGDEYDEPVWHLYVIRANQRAALKAALERRGVSTLIHYPTPCRVQGAYAQRALAQRSGLSDQLAAEVLSLPLWPEMADETVDYVIAAVQAAASEIDHISS